MGQEHLEIGQEHLDRGVRNPRIIDLIRPAGDGRGVVLVMIETRPWSLGRQQLEELDAKLNAYFVYVLDGHLVEQYPEYAGAPVEIRLDCVEEPGETERAMLREATRLAGEHGMSLVLRVVAPEAIVPAPWESSPGEEAGPAVGAPPYRYRRDVLLELDRLGVRPREATRPDRVRELLDRWYVFEIRELRLRQAELERFFGPQPRSGFSTKVQALRRKYAPLSLPLDRWTE